MPGWDEGRRTPLQACTVARGGADRAGSGPGAAAGGGRGGPAGAGGAGRGPAALPGPRPALRGGATLRPGADQPRRWLPWVTPPSRAERGGPAAAGEAARCRPRSRGGPGRDCPAAAAAAAAALPAPARSAQRGSPPAVPRAARPRDRRRSEPGEDAAGVYPDLRGDAVGGGDPRHLREPAGELGAAAVAAGLPALRAGLRARLPRGGRVSLPRPAQPQPGHRLQHQPRKAAGRGPEDEPLRSVPLVSTVRRGLPRASRSFPGRGRLFRGTISSGPVPEFESCRRENALDAAEDKPLPITWLGGSHLCPRRLGTALPLNLGPPAPWWGCPYNAGIPCWERRATVAASPP